MRDKDELARTGYKSAQSRNSGQDSQLLGWLRTAGLHVLAYERLVKALRSPECVSRVDTFMFSAVMDSDVFHAMQGDMLLLASPIMCSRSL